MTPRDPTIARATIADRLILGVILTAQLIWSISFIWGSSFLVDGERVFCLFDDAMISMTYARNLVEGHGLVWARHGDPVEGYTHPLWLLPMIAANLSGLELATRSLLVQVFSLGLLVANVIAVHRLCVQHFAVPRSREAGPPSSYPWVAAGLTAAFYPLSYWSLLGMEMALQSLLVVLGVRFALDMTEERRDRARELGIVLALAALLRLDMLIFAALTLAFVYWRGGFSAASVRSWKIAAAVFFGSLIGYQAFRWIYFGDPLPNTYYLKMTGVPLMARIVRGERVSDEIVTSMEESLYAPLLLAVALSFHRRRRYLALPAVLVVAYFGYSIWVGGDAWEYLHAGPNRFQTVVMPLVFVLVTAAVNTVGSWIESTPARALGRHLVPVAALLVAVAVGAQVNGLMDEDELRAQKAWERITQRAAPDLVIGHYRHVRDTRRLRESFPSTSRVAVVWAGIPAYFSDFEMVDVMGYNDYAIAHGPARQGWDGQSDTYFYPGHMKWNLGQTIRMHQPDVFMELWRSDASETATLRANGYEERAGLWVRAEGARERE